MPPSFEEVQEFEVKPIETKYSALFSGMHSPTLGARPPSAAWRSIAIDLAFSHSSLGRLTDCQDIQRQLFLNIIEQRFNFVALCDSIKKPTAKQ